MDSLIIAATNNTPDVTFDVSTNRLTLAGESHPEDAVEFYRPLLTFLQQYLEQLGNTSCVFDLKFLYFNSSSAKVIMMILEMLEETAEEGSEISVNWFYDEDDDNMKELGEEFGEDLEHVTFNLVAMAN